MKLLHRQSRIISIQTYKEPGFFSRTSFIQLGFGIWTSFTELGIGLAFGFSAVTVPQLQKNESSFHLTTADKSWISSILNLFSPIGCLVGGLLQDRYGRRFILIVSEIPMAVGWLYTALANSTLHIIIGRIITGLGIGLCIGAPRVYATEISLPNMRGVLGALISINLAAGLTLQALLGSFMDWHNLCYISAAFTSLLSVTYWFLPETPYYVLLKKTPADTRETLKKFRAKNYDIDDEMHHLIQYKDENEIRKSDHVCSHLTCVIDATTQAGLKIRLAWPYFRTYHFASLSLKNKCKVLFQKSTCEPFWIMIPYILVSQMSGVTVFTFYAVEILQNSKSSVDPHAGNVMMGLTRLLFGIVAAFLIYKFKRRGLVLISCFSISVICVILGIYLIYTENHTVFPMICYVLYISCASVGFYGLMLLIMCELYPLQVRGTLGGISVSILNLAIFGANKAFPYVKEEIGLPFTIICFGISALLGAIYLYFRLPETKGLTLEAIEQFFGKFKSMSHAAQTAHQFGPSASKAVSDSSGQTIQDKSKQVQEMSTISILGAMPRSNTTDRQG